MPAPRRSRKPIVLTVLAVAALAAGVVAVQKWLYGRVHESTENAQVDGYIMPIIARVGGTVTSVDVVENGRVQAGDTLIRLDPSELRAKLAQSDADLQAALVVAGGRGLDGQSEAAVRTASSQRGALDAQVRSAQAMLEKANADYARLKELADKQVISRQQLDAAQWAVTNASAGVEAAQRQLAGASASVENAQAGTRLAEARVAAARAMRANAALQLSYTSLVAPREGIVARKQVEVGQVVQAGQPLLTLVDDKDVWVTANFKETQLGRIHVGEAAELDIDAYAGCVAKGSVESVSPASGARFALLPPDNATGNFTKVVQRVPVRIRITSGCGADRPLRPGMSLEAHIETQ